MHRIFASILVSTLLGLALDARAAVEDSLDVHVMSLNVRWDGLDEGRDSWEYRGPRVAALIKTYAPDVVGLQEASRRQSRDLDDALPRHQVSVDDHPDAAYNSILFRAGRFRLESRGSFWLVESSDLPGGTRRCAWVRLIEVDSGRALYVYNVHLDHRSEQSRMLSVMALTAQIAKREHPDPFVVTGDLNDVERSPSIAYIEGRSSLRDQKGDRAINPVPMVDTFRVRHPRARNVGTAHGFRGIRYGRRIDFVFAPQEADVLHADILRDEFEGLYPSDHFAVSARVRLKF